MTEDAVLGQGLRLFTVQIRQLNSEIPVGTGFIVSPLGVIATCRHVLKAAGMDPDTGFVTSKDWELILNIRHQTPAKVGVYLPAVKESGVYREGHLYQAVFKACPRPFHDDVALLQLEPPVPELTPQEVAVISGANGSEGNRFASFGYRIRGEHDGGMPARGLVVGAEGVRSDRQRAKKELLMPMITMLSGEVKGGMSGSAVLDVEKNLVIGIVQSEWDSGRAGKDRDLCFAVDAAVLAKPPLEVSIHNGSLPLAPLRLNSLDTSRIKLDDVRAKNPGVSLNEAAPVVKEWVERTELSEFINSAWADDKVRVVALIGFGGSGKSTLARSWLESLSAKPDAVFWWNWNLRPNADDFFEAAVRHFTGDGIDLSDYSSSVLRARLLARLLEGGRYLFVLDGLESIQEQSDDLYGSIQSEPLREFLNFFAGSNHQSFCLITTRAPVVDLERFFNTFRWQEVDRLSQADGKALLRQFDVKLPDALLEEIVYNWRGHVLSLALIGGQLSGNDKVKPHQIPVPDQNVSERNHVRSLLREYDESLSDDERAVLFSVAMFRTAAPVDAIREIFPEMLQESKQATDLNSVINGLLSRRLIQRVNEDSELTEHPLIREEYHQRLRAENPERARHVHSRIGEFYSERALEPVESPQLPDLADWIEAAYHFCRAGQYDRAFRVYYDKLEQGDELVLSWKLNAYSTITGILEHFFPEINNSKIDTTEDPLVEAAEERRFLVNRLGVCRMNLGRLNEAPPLFLRAITIAEEADLLTDQLYSTENMVEVYSYLGNLRPAGRYAADAVRLARETGEAGELRDALAYQAWIAHLTGDIEKANAAFAEAEEVQAGVDETNPHLMSLYGIWHADHLRRTGNLDAAKSAVERVLAESRAKDMLDDISQCYRLLGDIASAASDHVTARQHYAEAVKLARNMSETTVLLEALLARGRWAATAGAEEARSDLDEALHYARIGSYKLYEADARVGLARVQHADSDKYGALAEAQRALKLATESTYEWAARESKALIAEIGG